MCHLGRRCSLAPVDYVAEWKWCTSSSRLNYSYGVTLFTLHLFIIMLKADINCALRPSLSFHTVQNDQGSIWPLLFPNRRGQRVNIANTLKSKKDLDIMDINKAQWRSRQGGAAAVLVVGVW